VTGLIAAPAGAQAIAPPDPIEQAIANREFPRALHFLDAALRDRPRDWRLWTLRGRVLSNLDRQAEGLKAYRRAIKLQPSYLPALEAVAEIEYSGGDPQAGEMLKRIILLQPANQAAHAMLAELAYERHDCRGAVAHFELASNQVNQKREALEHFGACLFELKRPGEAAAAFQHAVFLDPADTDAQFDFGLSLLEAKRPGEAINILRPLADRPVPESDVLGLLAEAYESAQQTQEAIDVLSRAAGLYPRDPQHYQFLAALCVKHDAYDLAGEVLDVGIRKLPDSASLRTMRGLLFMLTGQTERAELSFDEATRLAPYESLGRLGMGIALFSSGQVADSVGVLREQLARDPTDPRANYFLARVLLHQSYEPGTPEFEEARAALAKALAAMPDFTEARFLEAKMYLKLHRDADAIADLERTVDLDPTFGSAIYQLSRAYARTGRKKEAAKLATQIHELLVAERTHQTVHLAKTAADSPAH
jgi:tetratricopeptide (TPR) repeat protein